MRDFKPREGAATPMLAKARSGPEGGAKMVVNEPDVDRKSAGRSLTPFLNDYEQALLKLASLGVKTTLGRLRQYLDVLAFAEAQERACPEASHQHQDDATFQHTLLEASDIIGFASLDAELLRSHETLTKLRRIRKGHAIPNPDYDDPARNYAFEFSTAAAAAQRNSLVGFNAGDLEVGPPPSPIECKRLSSLTRLKANLVDARNQLVRGGRPGIIAVDLSTPIRADQGLTRPSTSEQAQGERIDHELTAYLLRYLDDEVLDSVVDPFVLGLIFRNRLVGSVGTSNRIRTAQTWQAFSLHEGSLNLQFMSATAWLADGPTINGSEADMRAAFHAVDIPSEGATSGP